MATRRNVLMAGAAAAALGPRLARAAGETADFLFVQTADAMTYNAPTNTLTLWDVATTTLFFSDRPERIAGNMKTSAFVPFWSKGKDSFLADNPNADLSIVENGRLRQVVVILGYPDLRDGQLTYTVRVLDGEMPDRGTDVSIFIDIIGMPLTPLSYAGAARRSYRRAFLY